MKTKLPTNAAETESLPALDVETASRVFEALSEAVVLIEFPGPRVLWSNSRARQIGIVASAPLTLPGRFHEGFRRMAIGVSGKTRYFEAVLISRGPIDIPQGPIDREKAGSGKAHYCAGQWFLILSGRQRVRERDLVSRVTRYCFEDIIGGSAAIANCLRLCRKAAACDLTVLLTGESGTGKELFAQSIHSGSSRREGPFVAINCGAIPRDLIESELFGHERGAFTGASAARPGRFELASGGTIFLDEIGEMPLAMQVRLLRVLQEREVLRVGGQKPSKIDVRVIAATNRDLPAMVSEGRFRPDLFFRLKVLSVAIPPLRERREDIRGLASRFLERNSLAGGPSGFSEKVMKALEAYDWPGNVRELENVVEVEASLSDGPVITHVPDYISAGTRGVAPQTFAHTPQTFACVPETFACVPETPGSAVANPADGDGGADEGLSLSDLEREAFIKAWRASQGSQGKVCSTLGISRATFYRKIKEYELK